MRRLEPILRRAFRGPCRVPAGARVLVAASGGADSTALLVSLARLRSELGIEVAAAHLHHGLRGAAADRDLDFVRALCVRLAVPLAAARWDTPRRLRRRGLSGQHGLRVLRREFLAGAARRFRADAIATAHTADDQLETLLLRLIRGTGLRGLGGMAPRSGRWLKPLLEATRLEIEADLSRAGQPWREDASNRDPRYARNRVRRDVVAALADAAQAPGPEGRARLARHAQALAAEARAAHRRLDRQASRFLARQRLPDGRLPVRILLRLPGASRRIVLARFWRVATGCREGLMGRNLQAVESLAIGARRQGRIELAGGWVAERRGDRLGMVRRAGPEGSGGQNPASRSVNPQEGPTVRFGMPGGLSLPGSGVPEGRIARRSASGRLLRRESAGRAFAALDVQGPLMVRRDRADDTLVPGSQRGTVGVGGRVRKQRAASEAMSHPTVPADAAGVLVRAGVRRSAPVPRTSGSRKTPRVTAESHD